MKKAKFILATALFFLLYSASQASAIDLYGFGSYWEKGDIDGTWGAGVGISLPFILDNIRLDGRAHFFESSDVGPDEVDVTPLDLGLQIHLFPEGTFDPYLLGGVSYNFVDTDQLDLDSEFGGYLGGGVDVDLGSPLFQLFGELFYRFSDIGEDTDWGELDASGFTGNIGLKFHFF
ncbi:MAG: outer membrane beta-barrel protein [Thermodesulfobacteriota bacterium]